MGMPESGVFVLVETLPTQQLMVDSSERSGLSGRTVDRGCGSGCPTDCGYVLRHFCEVFGVCLH